MSSKAEAALAVFKSYEGEEEGVGEWLTVDQDRINTFADATLDHQFIHIDPEKSAELSPYKVTIAHGFLTLSLIVHLGGSIPPLKPEALEGVYMGVNYGLDKVRFPAPVPVDSQIRRMTFIGQTLRSRVGFYVRRIGRPRADWVTQVTAGAGQVL